MVDQAETSPPRFPLQRFKYLLPFVALLGFIAWRQTRPVTAEVMEATRRSVAVEVFGTGTLESRVSSVISSTITARVIELTVDQGDRAAKGQVLARLDDSDVLREVQVAEAELAASNAAVASARAEVARMRAILAAARREQKRVNTLVKTSVLSGVEGDKAADDQLVAAAGFEASTSTLAQAELQSAARGRLLEFQRARLNETVIRAPFAGLVTRRHRELGDVLVPGSALLTYISTEDLWISAWVDETEIDALAVEQAARVVFRAEPDIEYVGTLSRLGREVDRETREFLVDVKIAQLPRNWAVGQRADVYIATEHAEDTLAIPTRALNSKGDQHSVFLLRGNRARRTVVRLGLRGHVLTEVIEGLSPGDQVLLGLDPGSLREGARIAVEEQ